MCCVRERKNASLNAAFFLRSRRNLYPLEQPRPPKGPAVESRSFTNSNTAPALLTCQTRNRQWTWAYWRRMMSSKNSQLRVNATDNVFKSTSI